MNSFSLTIKSLKSRKVSALLTMMAISVGVFLLIGVERIQDITRKGFEGTISQTDLIVGARGSPLQILLYSVFHIGNPLNNIRYSTFQTLQSKDEIEWAVPISLGDSHRSFRVIGSSQEFFSRVKTGAKKELAFANGRAFSSLFEVVVGAEVAKKLHYTLNQKIHLTHGVDATRSFEHENTPFTIVGVLEPTGTPFDKSLFVSLEALEAIHEGWESGAPMGEQLSAKELEQKKWEPKGITAFFVGLKSRLSVFKVQGEINNSDLEPLTSFLPGVALRDLWNTLGKAEIAMKILGVLVLVSNLLSLLLLLLGSLQERRREMAIYRSLGAGPFFMGKLLVIESIFLSLGGVLGAMILLGVSFFVFQTPLEQILGFQVPIFTLSAKELIYLTAVFVGAFVIALFPAVISYRQSLSDGLTVRS